jgi:hypothetical protein
MGTAILYRSPTLWLLSSDESFRKILNEAELSDLFFGDSADLESVMSYVTADISSAADLDDVRAIQLASARSQLLGGKSIAVLLGEAASYEDPPVTGFYKIRCYVTYIRATPPGKSDISVVKIQDVLSKHYPARQLRVKQIEPAASLEPPAASLEPPAASLEPPAASLEPPAASLEPPAASLEPLAAPAASRKDADSPSVSLWSFF